MERVQGCRGRRKGGSFCRRGTRGDAPVVVVHKAVRRGRIVGSSFSWNFFARPDRFKASIRGGAHPAAWQGGAYTYMRICARIVHDAYGSRAGSRRRGERIIEPAKWFSRTASLPSKLISMQSAIFILVTWMLIFLINSQSVHPSAVTFNPRNWATNYGWGIFTNVARHVNYRTRVLHRMAMEEDIGAAITG